MRIVLVSDTHLADRAAAFGDNWRAVRSSIASAPPDLIIHLGDISADGAASPSDLAEAARHFAGLPVPIRFLPGNHDIGDNPLDDGAVAREPPPDPGRLAHYRALFGGDRWSLASGEWQLIGINAQVLNTGGDEEQAQFAWLAHELAHGDGPLGLLLHKPLFRDGPTDIQSHGRYVPASARRRLLELVRRRDLRFVASGHVHQLRRIKVEGVEHVWVPATPFCIPDELQEKIGEKRLGALELVLDGAAHHFREIAVAGLTHHNVVDHPEVYPEIRALRARLGGSAL